jgi:hypothetical protein
MRTEQITARFWDHVDQSGDCWLWTGGIRRHGYGLFTAAKFSWFAHRFSWTLHYGPIPDGLYVCHRCDNPACVNPAHLFLGTQADNMHDMVRKGRHAWKVGAERAARGERIGASKLTADDVRAIRVANATGATQRQLAGQYGLCQSTVWKIVHRLQWVHVP